MKERMAALALAVLLTGCVGADGEIPDLSLIHISKANTAGS